MAVARVKKKRLVLEVEVLCIRRAGGPGTVYPAVCPGRRWQQWVCILPWLGLVVGGGGGGLNRRRTKLPGVCGGGKASGYLRYECSGGRTHEAAWDILAPRLSGRSRQDRSGARGSMDARANGGFADGAMVVDGGGVTNRQHRQTETNRPRNQAVMGGRRAL